MPGAPSAVSIGIDFGTSNTVVALAADDRRVEAVRFDHGGHPHSVYVSALCFWEDRPGSGARAEGGPWAIEQFLEGRHVCRFPIARSRCDVSACTGISRIEGWDPDPVAPVFDSPPAATVATIRAAAARMIDATERSLRSRLDPARRRPGVRRRSRFAA